MDAELLDVDRQERQQHAEADEGRERAEYADEQIALPIGLVAFCVGRKDCGHRLWENLERLCM